MSSRVLVLVRCGTRRDDEASATPSTAPSTAQYKPTREKCAAHAHPHARRGVNRKTRHTERHGHERVGSGPRLCLALQSQGTAAHVGNGAVEQGDAATRGLRERVLDAEAAAPAAGAVLGNAAFKRDGERRAEVVGADGERVVCIAGGGAVAQRDVVQHVLGLVRLDVDACAWGRATRRRVPREAASVQKRAGVDQKIARTDDAQAWAHTQSTLESNTTPCWLGG